MRLRDSAERHASRPEAKEPALQTMAQITRPHPPRPPAEPCEYDEFSASGSGTDAPPCREDEDPARARARRRAAAALARSRTLAAERDLHASIRHAEARYQALRRRAEHLRIDMTAVRGRLRQAGYLSGYGPLPPGWGYAPEAPTPDDPLWRRPLESVALRDGSLVGIRPLLPTDREQLAAGFDTLSAASRRRRFLRAVDRLSTSELDHLVDVDHRDHEALVAVDPVTGRGVGVARYIRDATDRRRAEVAVAVSDDRQRLGVGGALVDRLAIRARHGGVRTITALVANGNEPAVRLLGRLAPPTVIARYDGALEFSVAVAGRRARPGGAGGLATPASAGGERTS